MKMTNSLRPLYAALLVSAMLAGISSYAADAAVTITHARANPTFAGQTSTAAFMTLKADADTTLTAVDSPVAAVAQVHEMSMQGGVMAMRAHGPLALPAGSTVVLAPRELHIMLLDLKRPLLEGEKVPLTLHFKSANGSAFDETVQLEIHRDAAGAS